MYMYSSNSRENGGRNSSFQVIHRLTSFKTKTISLTTSHSVAIFWPTRRWTATTIWLFSETFSGIFLRKCSYMHLLGVESGDNESTWTALNSAKRQSHIVETCRILQRWNKYGLLIYCVIDSDVISYKCLHTARPRRQKGVAHRGVLGRQSPSFEQRQLPIGPPLISL